jgi:hypothetical protein
LNLLRFMGRCRRVASWGMHFQGCVLAFALGQFESGAAQATGTNEAWCPPTNAPFSVKITGAQSTSTLRMVERLKELREHANLRANPFLSDRRAQAMEQSLVTLTNLTLEQQMTFRSRLGVELVQAGRSEDALKQYQTVQELADGAGVQLVGQSENQLRMLKAQAMLRLGEQENCLANHNADSCLFPLVPNAYHRLPRGSRGAIELLNEQLSKNPKDLSARWLLNIAYMTLGEYPDKVPGQWVVPSDCFASTHSMPRFPNIAGELGLDSEGLAGGCILDDFDNDGLIDIVKSSWALDGQLRYFHNDGNGRFTERTREAGLTGLVGGLNILQTDYNNDGLLDIFVLRGAWLEKEGRMPKSLLRNNGDGTFTDVTEEAGLLSLHPSQTAVWFDYDGDGWLDLFIGNETLDSTDPDPCQLFHNNHNGTFTECGAACGLAVQGFVKGVTCADYDHDGRPDLYITTRNGGNRLFHNDGPNASGQWRFSDVTRRAGVSDPQHSFSTWFFDYDNDGWEDIFVSGYAVQNVGEVAADYLGQPTQGALTKLYHNNHDGTFTDVTAAAHLNHVLLTMGCNFGDLDNDGWLDFYLGTGNPDLSMLIPNRMFRNAEGKYFDDVTTATGTGHLQKGHGVGFADLNNDGAQEIYAVIGGSYPGETYRTAVFFNPGNSNHWIKLKLEGTRSNRAAIGARLKVTVATIAGPRQIYKTVNSGGSFGCSPLRQEIGLGNASKILDVEIDWPGSGVHQSLKDLDLDRCYRIRESDPHAVVWGLKRFDFDLKSVPHTHVHAAAN